ncbi:DBB domain-containing protein [Caerostris extrusa]|uniref:DBB domain-containing protein n=1 Tax=Caerostris extrusa TaxID=172846 RepID=A0AAV4X8S3_CAEEX|nr:DBB domain-containing protein [Caerostris extrusa]
MREEGEGEREMRLGVEGLVSIIASTLSKFWKGLEIVIMDWGQVLLVKLGFHDMSKIIPTHINKTDGLPVELEIFARVKVMLRSNIDVKKGLVNGAIDSSPKFINLISAARESWEEEERADVQALPEERPEQQPAGAAGPDAALQAGESTISNVEKEFQQWRRKHCTSQEEQMKRTRKTSAFAFMWKKPKKKDSKNGNGCKQFSDAKQEEKVSTRKISNTSASSASSKTSTSTFSSREDTTSSEQKLDEFCTAPTKWVSSYSPSTRRLFQPHYLIFHRPFRVDRPLAPPLTKPVPLPRKKLPPGVRAESSRIIEEEKSTDLKQDQLKPADDEDKNVSIVELCEKYGLQTLGKCFISGTCLSREQLAKADNLWIVLSNQKWNIQKPLIPLSNQNLLHSTTLLQSAVSRKTSGLKNELGKEEPEPVRTRDSDGYEIPIRLRFRIQEDLLNMGRHQTILFLATQPAQVFRTPKRPVADPIVQKCGCNERERGFFSDVLQLRLLLQHPRIFSSNIYMSLLDYSSNECRRRSVTRRCGIRCSQSMGKKSST